MIEPLRLSLDVACSGERGPGRRDANQRGWGGLLPHFAAACGY